MARYFEQEDRYAGGLEIIREDDLNQVTNAQDEKQQIDQVTVPQVTADQNNYALPPNGVIIVTTDATRHFTGFTGAAPGLKVFCNGGSNDAVIDNDSASSTTQNRTLCHTGANITLNPKESAILFYDYANSRWRTVGFS